MDYSKVKTKISKSINKYIKKGIIKGLSIALLDDNDIVWKQGFGYADIKANKPSTAETFYKVGSISKLFTATAIMQLVEKGEIDLDAPVKEYIPEFKVKSRFEDYTSITIRMLLTHHSGLPGNKLKGTITKGMSEDLSQVLTHLQNEYVAYPPNYIYAYSNLGYTILGIVIERISGKPFYDYMEKNLLIPLGMNMSSFILKKDMKDMYSKAYTPDGLHSLNIQIRDKPAGSMFSNVLELSKFIKMIFNEGEINNKRLLNKESIDEMLKPQNEDIPLDIDFRTGLSWFLTRPGLSYAGKVCSHHGGTPYYKADLIILPEYKLGVVILANSEQGEQTVKSLTEETLKEALKVKKGIKAPKKTVGEKPVKISES
ncbi:MAG: serine hydrolase domain-containing protein, partial [Spirochaetota bacterium]